MSGVPSNAVFISYRREEGGFLAMALYQHLTEHGLDAFYDIESIRAGQFDTIILNQIAARPVLPARAHPRHPRASRRPG